MKKGDLITHKGMILCHKAGHPARVGEEIEDYRGDPCVIAGGAAPHREPSTGRIWLCLPGDPLDEYFEVYPSVVDCFWREMRPVEIAHHGRDL